ncbi:MAG: DUF2788 domain-containing protein [Desulfovibrionaceae bacterium]|jgi:hypothetical protein|nr:DUF2788 domain-containing protein [Desulfovibrionaceae bacterium]
MNTLFGFTEAQVTSFGLTVGVGGLMAYMLFIIGQLAWESKAGKFGTFVLFLALGLSMVGFITKLIIEKVIEHRIDEKRAHTTPPPASAERQTPAPTSLQN